MRNLTELDKYRDFGPAIIRFFGSAGDETCMARPVLKEARNVSVS